MTETTKTDVVWVDHPDGCGVIANSGGFTAEVWEFWHPEGEPRQWGANCYRTRGLPHDVSSTTTPTREAAVEWAERALASATKDTLTRRT